MKQQPGLSARARTRSLARGRDRSRAACIAICVFFILGTQSIGNFRLYRRPNQNIHLISPFGNNDSSAGYTIQMSVSPLRPCWCLPGPQIHARIGQNGPKRPYYEIRVMQTLEKIKSLQPKTSWLQASDHAPSCGQERPEHLFRFPIDRYSSVVEPFSIVFLEDLENLDNQISKRGPIFYYSIWCPKYGTVASREPVSRHVPSVFFD